MSLNAQGYFNALRSYLNTSHYGVAAAESGTVILREKVFLAGNQEKDMRVRLTVPGEALAINLDKKISRNSNQSHPLFHFLDNNAKPWSKRCDFVIFHLYRGKVSAFLIEFKSGSFPEGLVDQMKSSEAWCRALHSIIKLYTGQSKRLHLTKYVLTCHADPAAYLDASGKYLLRDHCIRHYLYQDIDGLALDALDNTNVEVIS